MIQLLLLLLWNVVAECDAQRSVRVSNGPELVAAITNVRAGDEIIIASGKYFSPLCQSSFLDEAFIVSTVSGTADQRIILRGENPDNPPIIFGTDIQYWSVIRLHSGAHYWVIKDLVLNVAQIGVTVDASNFVEIRNLLIQRTGQEAIHIRSGSKNTLIEKCRISETGQDNAGYGEGIYIGSDRSVHKFYALDVGNTVVRNNVIGPFVRGEPFDVKEGTFGTVIEYNTVDAKGLSGQNFADSFMDIKGSRTVVRYNTFNRNGATALNKGIAIIDRNTENSAFENVIHDNIFNFDDGGSAIPMVSAGGGTTANYMYDNTRIPAAGGQSDGNVIAKCCPAFYTEPSVSVCFSGEMKVQEERKGIISMKELRKGDTILAANDRYERVYSFGHRDDSQQALFMQFLPSQLELSPDHMVMVSGKGAIPATMVEVGDRFIGGETVHDIRHVNRTGVFAPFTPSGTIVVNGVLASTYVSFQRSNRLRMGSMETPITFQWLAHACLAPYRIWCRSSRMAGSSDGISSWVALSLRAALWFLEQPLAVMGLMIVPVILLLILFWMTEILHTNPIFIIILIVTMTFMRGKAKTSQKR